MASLVAAGGYGKTVLALELARELGVASAIARLEPGDDHPVALVQRLTAAFRRRGLSDLVDALELHEDPSAAVDSLVAALAEGVDSVLVVVDEVEYASDGAGPLVTRLARGLPEGCRLLLAGRTVPSSLDGIVASGGAVALGQSELAFSTAETTVLLQRVGVTPSPGWADRLHRVSAGWPLAVALAAERLGNAADPGAELERIEASPTLVSGLLAGPLGALPVPAADAVRQLAHLPHLSAEIADRATGIDRIVEQAVAAGVPFQLSLDGVVELPGPVREAITGRTTLDPAVAARAAEAYAAAGMGPEAVRVLVSAGEAERAAETAAALTPQEVSRLDVRELRALLASIPPEALDRHPRALMHLARACEASAERDLRTGLLERAAVAATGDPALRREIDAELARDLVRDGHVDEAVTIAERLLAEAAADELLTRVRALHVLGRTYAWRGDPESMAAAEPLLEEAAELYGRIGFQAARAHALLALAYDVLTVGGRFDAAVSVLEQALAGLQGRSRLRGVILVFHAEALIDLGRLQEAEASLGEAEPLGSRWGDTRTLGYTAWLRARVAAPLGDAARVREQLAEAERHRGAWFEHHTGVEFLAEAALLLGQVGETRTAADYLARARERQAEAPPYVQLAAGAGEARHGDPARAEAVLASLPDLSVRESWRVALLRGLAAHRAGDLDRASALAREAFALAARTSAPDLPLRREPAIAAVLLPLVDRRLEDPLPPGPPATITVLGGFDVRRAGEALALPPGRPTLLVKLLAVRGGRLTSDEAIEALWPGVEPTSGRKRLRNTLHRLREAAGELVVRSGEALSLADGTDVDCVLFERASREATGDPRARTAPERARAALGLYAGEALPDDRFADWAVEPRERLQTSALALLDLLVADAEREGAIDEALRLLDRAIEADRLDESRYLHAARLLLRQGRRGRALDVLRASAAALRELDLQPSAEHAALVRSTRD
jgi:DNA-binding SARP family transcriptional activator/ATP/maltotriose-dependent transcriptional regulator MalT